MVEKCTYCGNTHETDEQIGWPGSPNATVKVCPEVPEMGVIGFDLRSWEPVRIGSPARELEIRNLVSGDDDGEIEIVPIEYIQGKRKL